jgi:hypothetical protein
MPEGSMARRLREALLAAAAALIDLVDGHAERPAPVRVRVERNGCKLSYEAGVTAGIPSGPDPPPSPPAGTSDRDALASAFFTYLERKLVRLLTAGARKQSGILAGLPDERNHSHIKAVLAGLVERGVLEVTRDGYAVRDPLFSELAARG